MRLTGIGSDFGGTWIRGRIVLVFFDIARYTEEYLITISGAFMKSTLNSTSATSPFIWMAYIQVLTIAVYFHVKFQPWLIDYISSI